MVRRRNWWIVLINARMIGLNYIYPYSLFFFVNIRQFCVRSKTICTSLLFLANSYFCLLLIQSLFEFVGRNNIHSFDFHDLFMGNNIRFSHTSTSNSTEWRISRTSLDVVSHLCFRWISDGVYASLIALTYHWSLQKMFFTVISTLQGFSILSIVVLIKYFLSIIALSL